jgi:predicted transcriptional regulator
MERTTIYLPEDLHRSLREAARRAGRPKAELIREALTAYLQAQPRPIARSIGLGSDEGLAGRDTEQWLEEA